MSELQIQAALRMKAALLSQSKEKARDLFYLRQAGSKGVSVAWDIGAYRRLSFVVYYLIGVSLDQLRFHNCWF